MVEIKKDLAAQALTLSRLRHRRSLIGSRKAAHCPHARPQAKFEEEGKRAEKKRVKDYLWKKTESEENAASLRLNHCTFSLTATHRAVTSRGKRNNRGVKKRISNYGARKRGSLSISHATPNQEFFLTKPYWAHSCIGKYWALIRLRHRTRLESVSGLTQHALGVDVFAKVWADNLGSLVCQPASEEAKLPQRPRTCNRSYAAHLMQRMPTPRTQNHFPASTPPTTTVTILSGCSLRANAALMPASVTLSTCCVQVSR